MIYTTAYDPACLEAVGKPPSAVLSSSLVTTAYFYVRLIPRDFRCLASGDFPSASNGVGSPQAARAEKNIK